MKTNIIRILFVLIMSLILTAPGFCTQLPESVVEFIKEKFPKAGIRFDGLVELPDETVYLPILPLVYDELENPVKIVQTIPVEQNFSQKPDMILFNNNLALLKIIKKQGKSPTVTSSNEMPLKIKLGLLPQDLVVPSGLILPPELKVILGDLKIPLKQKTDKEGEVAFYNKIDDVTNIANTTNTIAIIGKSAEYIQKLPELDFLSGKILYTSNYRDNKLYMLNSGTGRVRESVILPSMSSDMVLTPDKRYVLMTCPVKNKIFVIDIFNNEFVKTLDAGKFPSSIILAKSLKKAYVSNRLSSSISEIDIKHMQVEREISVTGYPDNLQISENKKFIFYNDYISGKIYQLNPDTGEIKYLFQDKNISKIGQFGRYFFSLSRSEGTLTVFDLKKSEITKKTQTGKKPLDFKILDKLNKIFVLCAESDELNIIDMENFDITKRISLKSGGFPGKINLIKGSSKVLITNYDAYEMIIYDIDTEKVQGYLPVSHRVSSMIISDK